MLFGEKDSLSLKMETIMKDNLLMDFLKGKEQCFLQVQELTLETFNQEIFREQAHFNIQMGQYTMAIGLRTKRMVKDK